MVFIRLLINNYCYSAKVAGALLYRGFLLWKCLARDARTGII